MSLVHGVPRWHAEAACQDAPARYFYPPAGAEPGHARRRREDAARALCGRCPVRAACLQYALSGRDPYGIWGGLTEAERRRLLRREARSSRSATAADAWL